MTSCVSVRCGAVWWETSAPLLLQNPLITWFYLCVGFFISKEGRKKGHKHTNSVQMTTKEMQLQETHSPPALHWAHSGWAACEPEWEDEPALPRSLTSLLWWSLWSLNWCGLPSSEVRHAAEWWFVLARVTDQDIMTALWSHAQHHWETPQSYIGSHFTDFTTCGVQNWFKKIITNKSPTHFK